MRILIDILHPAQLHVLRNFRDEMLRRGHDVHVAARDKDLTVPLLNGYGIPATILSKQRTGLLGLAAEWSIRATRLTRLARRIRPDVLIGVAGPVIAPVGKLLRIPTVVLYDAENAARTNRFVYPLATVVVTGDSYTGRVNGRHVTHAGYHQSAYLHPNRFEPDDRLLRAVGIDPDEWYAIVRFVSWEASHDFGQVGLSDDQKRQLVKHLSRRGRVLISSEGPLPQDLAEYQLSTPPELIHHVIAYARVVVGESATMASEAAVLGVPAVYIRDTGRGFTDEQERRYGLVRNVVPGDFEGIMVAIDEMLSLPAGETAHSHQRLLADMVDLTAWLIDFVENRHWEAAA